MTFYSHYPGLTCSPDTCPSASLRCPGGCSRLPCAEDLFHSRPANCDRFLCCEITGCSIEVKEVNSKINRAANHSKVSKTVEIIRFGHIIKTFITFITFAKRNHEYERAPLTEPTWPCPAWPAPPSDCLEPLLHGEPRSSACTWWATTSSQYPANQEFDPRDLPWDSLQKLAHFGVRGIL